MCKNAGHCHLADLVLPGAALNTDLNDGLSQHKR